MTNDELMPKHECPKRISSLFILFLFRFARFLQRSDGAPLLPTKVCERRLVTEEPHRRPFAENALFRVLLSCTCRCISKIPFSNPSHQLRCSLHQRWFRLRLIDR